MNLLSEQMNDLIKNSPILTKNEINGLVSVMNTTKNAKKKQEARDKLFASNLKLVLNEVHYYHNNCRNISFEDILSAGLEGLGEAINRFNPKKYHTKLSTYAVPWIQAKIMEFLNEFAASVYIPRHIMHKSRIHYRIISENRNNPLSEKEILKKLNVSKKILKKIQCVNCTSISLDQNCSQQNDDNNEMTLKDLIPDPKSKLSHENLMQKETKDTFSSALMQLTPLQKDIIEERYFTGEKVNLKEIGKKHNLSAERVRQIEYKAIRLLKRRLRKHV